MSTSTSQEFTNPQVNGLFRADQPEQNEALEGLGATAYKLSYIGSVLLTADHIVRSVDSVLNSMEVSWADGSELRFRLQPSSGGFKAMLKLSRPIEF